MFHVTNYVPHIWPAHIKTYIPHICSLPLCEPYMDIFPVYHCSPMTWTYPQTADDGVSVKNSSGVLGAVGRLQGGVLGVVGRLHDGVLGVVGRLHDDVLGVVGRLHVGVLEVVGRLHDDVLGVDGWLHDGVNAEVLGPSKSTVSPTHVAVCTFDTFIFVKS